MTTLRLPRSVLALASMALLSSAASADWSNKVGLNAKVHDHKFDRVALSGEGCALTFKLGFNAPHKAYKSRVKARNSYLFRARAQLKSGKQFETQVFRSGSAARRTFTQRFDTDGEGCWGKEKLQVIDVKVVGCRGKGCKVPDFE